MRENKRYLLYAVCALACLSVKLNAETITPYDFNTNTLNPPSSPNDPLPPVQSWFDASKATLLRAHAQDLIGATMGACLKPGPTPDDPETRLCNKGEKSTFPGKKDFVVIHVASWKDATVDKQNWYVYSGDTSDEAAFASNRIFGRKHVYLLVVFLNAPADSYILRYTADVKPKLPVYIDHLVQIGQTAFNLGSVVSAQAAVAPANLWGATVIDASVPSDLILTPEVFPAGGGAAITTLDSKTFDNEGKYHLDFTVGVPIKKISDISYTSASNTVVPTKVDKQTFLALFDYYPHAVDLKQSGWSKYPSLVFGVGAGSQPLKKGLIGIGYGPLIANFYAGLLLNTSALPAGVGCGTTPSVAQAQGKLSNKTCPEFSFGVNVSVGSVMQTLKSKAASTSGTGTK